MTSKASRAGSLPQEECIPLWERACSRRHQLKQLNFHWNR
ncbi:hypothetical protein PG5_35530 [Pseudomonas sp. G5(2012)]|nr:hypothetical protein PG5_35530 [Pseudomonas sp. G5(2012)]